MSIPEKTVIVTGANSGLGFQVSRLLCKQKYNVILACRSEERGQEAVSKIKLEDSEARATFMKLDLSDLSSVRDFVKNFEATGKSLDVLINNAGVFITTNGPRQLTKDNFELTVGVNHLGHFLLTNLLLPILKRTAAERGEARIVVVASELHDAKKGMKKDIKETTIDNLMQEENFYGFQAYKNSKLANVMFTYELGRQLEGTGVTVNCLCPGFIPETNLSRNGTAMSRFMIRYLLKPMFWAFNITRSLEQGSQAIVYLATDTTLKDVNGKFFKDQKESTSSEESHNEEMQKELWALSARLCHLEGYELVESNKEG